MLGGKGEQMDYRTATFLNTWVFFLKERGKKKEKKQEKSKTAVLMVPGHRPNQNVRA